MRSSYKRRLERMEEQLRATDAGLLRLLEHGQLTVEQLTDDELSRVLAAPCPGAPLVAWHTLTDAQLQHIAATGDVPADWAAQHS